MQALEFDPTCPDCSKRLIDAGDELVCPCCGRTREKEVLPSALGQRAAPALAPNQALGSFMGSRSMTRKETLTRGITGTGSNYKYLKVVSDFAGRSDGTPAACARLIERMGEKLCLPRVVRLEAAMIARKVLATEHPRRRMTTAAVSAYSLITACKLEGATSVSIREIIDAHAVLGRQVTSSSIIQLTLESPVKTSASSPEDYLSRVIARLSMNQYLRQQLSKEGVFQTAFFNALRTTAMELLRTVSDEAKVGRRPSALAGSAVYSAELVLSRCESRRRRLTQRDIAECGDTAEYTIREQCARVFAPAVECLVRQRMQSLCLPAVR